MMLGDGNGGFTFRDNGTTQVGLTPRQSGAVGDFNLDGKPDIALSGLVFLGDGTGRVAPATNTADVASVALLTPFIPFGLVVTTDLNLDGKPDLVMTKFSALDRVITLLASPLPIPRRPSCGRPLPPF